MYASTYGWIKMNIKLSRLWAGLSCSGLLALRRSAEVDVNERTWRRWRKLRDLGLYSAALTRGIHLANTHFDEFASLAVRRLNRTACLQSYQSWLRTESSSRTPQSFHRRRVNPAHLPPLLPSDICSTDITMADIYPTLSSSSSCSRSRLGPSRRCTTMSTVDSTSPEVSNRRV